MGWRAPEWRLVRYMLGTAENAVGFSQRLKRNPYYVGDQSGVLVE